MLKQRLWVWLPPDGDTRAGALKQAWGTQTGRMEFWIRPEFLVLPPDLSPPARLESGDWNLTADGLFLEVFCSGSLQGQLRLAERWQGQPPDLDLGPPPAWSWRRGRLAWMNEDTDPPKGQWSWEFEVMSGWKGEGPTS